MASDNPDPLRELSLGQDEGSPTLPVQSAAQRLEGIVRGIEFQDWRFYVVDDIPDVHLQVRFNTTDAYSGAPRELQFVLDWPHGHLVDDRDRDEAGRVLVGGYRVSPTFGAPYTDAQVVRRIFDFIVRDVFPHEIGEFFLYQGVRVFDPHLSRETDNRYASRA